MTNEIQINRESHIKDIDAAIQELLALQARTKAPSPLPHQFIGTIVDNAIALLTAPANALDGGRRTVTFSESRNWLSLIKGVHRTFFASIHTATELGLTTLCQHRGVQVRSRLQEATEGPIRRVEEHAGHLPAVHRAIKDLRAVMRTNRPAFDDYLEGALSTVNVPENAKKTWRKFFRALSILRNKASHPDPTLTEPERERLRQGGFGALISPTGDLTVNPRMYQQIATFVLNFFDLLCDVANVLKSGAS